MSQIFLKAAYDVLCDSMKPLTVKEIIEKADARGFLNSTSNSPGNIMQARLSEHINNFGNGSTFVRHLGGKIALREWSASGHRAKLFYKQKNEVIVGLTQNAVDDAGRFFGFSKDYQKHLALLADNKNLRVQSRKAASESTDIKQLITYVVLKNHKGEILTQRRAASDKTDSLIKGALSIAFGGHTNEKDIDLFDQLSAGINNCAHREIFEEIKGLRLDNLEIVGVINDDSSPLGYNKFAFVFEGTLSKDFDCSKYAKEATITQIKMMKTKELWHSFHDLEFWSQLILKKYLCKKEHIPTIIKSRKRAFLSSPLIIMGEIGAGKTEVTNILKHRTNATVISMRGCICEVLGIFDFGDGNRVEFQRQALELISKPKGVKQLLENISIKLVKAGNSPVIIDGVRNQKVFNLLKRSLKSFHVMFVEAPRDIAYTFFQSRAKTRVATIDDFREERHHDVEREVASFKSLADVIVYNSGSLKSLNARLNEWLIQKNKSPRMRALVNQ